ncbi:NAD-dependent epimerase/dehydratase family protein [Polaromonas aquatica]|uniref:NAD-dependent epimerase/dehydratase family protein n=1 Tax=Polaromonas aquatica TaxID=332657 RepID=UPI003D652549
MRVLVLGGSGHIGGHLLKMLHNTSWAVATGASRRKRHAKDEEALQTGWLELDSRDAGQLASALKNFDAVVNCVAGDGASISEGMHALVDAALKANCPRIVHLSTMSVYGPAEGLINEDAPRDPGLGWYGRAKCEAEASLQEFVRRGGEAVMLRPGCVFGPGSELWVGRIGRWLRSGRLGDLGVAGDGWSNLVHVDDVCQALLVALQLPVAPGELPVFNLAAPDSPRWNGYFVDLALELKATPVRRISRRQLQVDSWVGGPPLKAAERALKYLGSSSRRIPDALPPGLLRLWAQHIRLDSQAATEKLGLTWTPYTRGLHDSARWFCTGASASNPTMEKIYAFPDS